MGHFGQLQVEGGIPYEACDCLTTLRLKVCTQSNFAADFLRKKYTIRGKNGQFAFWALGGLGATYTVHLRLISKLVVDFLLVIIELFSLGERAEAVRANID